MFSDKVILDKLSDLRNLSFSAYINVKLNIDAILQKISIIEADRAMEDWFDSEHRIYQIKEDTFTLVGDYLQIDTTNASACYLVVIDDIYAGLYIYNQNNFVQSRKHLFGKDSINDFFDTFHKHLEIANEPDNVFGRILNIKEGYYDL